MKKFLLSIVFFFPFLLLSQSISIEWLDNDVIYAGEDSITVLSFKDADYIDGSYLPYYHYSQKLNYNEVQNNTYKVSISSILSSPLSEVSDIDTTYLGQEYNVIYSVSSSQKSYALEVYILPIKKSKGVISRLEKCQLNISSTPKIELKSSSSRYTENSVLSSGNWQKLSVDKTGIYKLTYQEISDMGITPEDVCIFTSTPGKLSKTIDNYIDDLQEIAIYENKGEDGVFNSGDYILFYGESQNIWNYDSSSKQYIHTKHPFWNENYYFITSDVGTKKRITQAENISKTSTKTYTTFLDYDFIEPDEINIENSGDDWFSNKLYDEDSYSYTFSFSNVVQESATMTMKLAAHSVRASHVMNTYINNNKVGSITLANADNSSTGIAAYQTTKNYYFIPESNNIPVKMTFSCSESTAYGLVDYFAVQLKRQLLLDDNYLIFRNKPTPDSVVTYRIAETDSSSLIWDVTDAFNTKEVNTALSGDTLVFNYSGNVIKELVAINPNGTFLSPTVVEKVSNQNIHGRDVPDMIIVTCDDFEDVANRFAEIHSDLDVFVVTQSKIFNEFSGGKADNTAIRWMLKMFYDRSSDGNELKYLLLLGDGDVNNRMYEDESSLVMTYESDESFNRSVTYVSDDYYGLLDDNEGNGTNIELTDKVDIGIGRIPINSTTEGEDVINKIKTYIANNKRTFWKNRICFIADDEDKNTHIIDANNLAEKVRYYHNSFAVKKVYFDAFKQKKKSDGYYYPEAKKLSDNYIENGCLIWSYSGHGSPTTLATEKIMYFSDILEFSNIQNMPLWITASCDYCPYDNNEGISAGEKIILSSKGAGIGMFTTTRLVYSSSNYAITNNFFSYVLTSDSETGEKLCLGDIARLTKKVTGTGANKRKFSFIGDPALQLVYPDERWTVVTDSINGQFVDEDNAYSDTIKALDLVTISGSIQLEDNTIDTTFSGTVFTTIYDKISELKTLANDGSSKVMNFKVWNSIIYNGSVNVINGRFNFSFIVPKSIDYSLGNGRIEYYATSEEIEANGFFENFEIGSYNNDCKIDTIDPEIDLYLNSTSFIDGDEVDSNPVLIAHLSDQSGINTSSNSMGHSITIELNNDANTKETINSSYTVDSEDYTKGEINYQLSDLEEGEYTLTLKVWDVQNNSASKTINFVVKDETTSDISVLYCMPNPVSLSSKEKVTFTAKLDSTADFSSLSLYVLDCLGKIVYKTSDYSSSSDNTTLYFNWNPSSSSVTPGLYFYCLSFDDGNSVKTGDSKKILIK